MEREPDPELIAALMLTAVSASRLIFPFAELVSRALSTVIAPPSASKFNCPAVMFPLTVRSSPALRVSCPVPRFIESFMEISSPALMVKLLPSAPVYEIGELTVMS